MFMLYAVLIAVAIGYIRGGRLAGIVESSFRWSWTVLAAIVIQLIIFSGFSWVEGLPATVGVALHLVSYLLVLVFIIANIRERAIAILGTGTLLNFLVIILNGGYMPTPAANFKGVQQAGEVNNNTMLADSGTLLPWLGDIFHLPSWLPLTNAFSIGDIFIAVGVFLYILKYMKPVKA